MKKGFWLDTVLGTAFIFFMMYVVVKIFSFFDVLDPIGEALDDMQLTDLRFSALREDPTVNEDIVVVNFGNLDRAGIAEQIRIINNYNPKVIAIDAFFDTHKEGWKDTLLMNAMSEVENLVLVSKVAEYNPESDIFDTLLTSLPMFAQYSTTGQANLISYGSKSQEDFKAVRTFSPNDPVKNQKEQELAFAVKAAQLYDPEAVREFIDRGNETEIINYRGNIIDFGRSEFGNMFYALDVIDVFNENFTPDVIEGKIVFIGFLGDDFFDSSWDDKFFTPMNSKYAGRANPDMFGVVIHANIAAMVLDKEFINSMPDWFGIVFGIVMCYLNVILFTLIYKKLPRWYDGLTKIIQLIEVLILFFIMVMVFANFDFKLEITLAAAAIALAGDSLEVFHGVVKNLFSAEGRKQLFEVYKS